MTDPRQIAEASHSFNGEEDSAAAAKARLDWQREHDYELFLTQFTDRELELAKFCDTYADVSFARIIAGVPLETEIDEATHDKYGPYEIVTPAPHDLDEELTSLIERGLLDHRVDLTGLKLVKYEESAWTGIRGKAMAVAAEIERELLLGNHRVNIVLAGWEVE